MSGMLIQQYNLQSNHTQSFRPCLSENISSLSTNSISSIVRSLIFTDVQYSEIQQLPNDISMSMKMDVLHPLTRKWVRVNVVDVKYLQERNLNTTHLNQLLKKGISIARGVIIAKEIPKEEGEILVEQILEKVRTANVNSGLFSYFYRTINFFSKRITSLMRTDETLVEAGKEIKPNKNISLNKEAEVKSELMWHWNLTVDDDKHGFTLKTISKLLLKEDYLFFVGMGLNRKLLKELYQKKIYVHDAVAVSHSFPYLKRDELFRKILEAVEGPQMSSHFQEWEKNLFTRCSKEGLKDPGPKALFLISKHFYAHSGRAEIQNLLQRVASIYNTCVVIFARIEEFTGAIASHKDIKLLYIIAHGDKSGNYMKLDDYLFYGVPSNFKNDYYSSLFSEHLDLNAHVVVNTCFGGNGRGQKKNWPNFIYRNSPPGVKVFAPTQEIYNHQAVLTLDTEGSLWVKFWYYVDISNSNNSPIFESIGDATYIVSSETQFSDEVLS